MKKYILLLFGLSILFSSAKSQDLTTPYAKGKWLIESNTGFGNLHPGNTGISFKMSNGQAVWNIGGEGGYFLANNLALKLGLGFGNLATGPTSVGGSEAGETGNGLGEAGEGGNGLGEAGEAGSGSTYTGTGGVAVQGIGPIFTYKIGAKYYALERIPLQLDFSGTNVVGYNFELGVQAGYAFRLGATNNLSFEPGVRLGTPLKQRVGTIDNMVQLNMGMAYVF